MENITVENFKEKIKEGKVLVDFYADWCGPCKMVTPVLEELASENPEVNIYKLDVDEQGAIAAEYGVRSIPTIIYFIDGMIADKKIGAHPKSTLQEMLLK